MCSHTGPDWDITREQGISHKAARAIVENYEGKIPRDLGTLRELPGVGRSTAGAILSLGFGLRGVIQDGNVRRVLARLFAITGDLSKSKAQNELWSLADSLTPQTGEACRIHTQAMMDLGSIVCRRTRSRLSGMPVPDRLPRLSTEQCCQISSSKTDE